MRITFNLDLEPLGREGAIVASPSPSLDEARLPPVILVDTSVWDRLSSGDAARDRELEAGRVSVHRYVFGELAPRG